MTDTAPTAPEALPPTDPQQAIAKLAGDLARLAPPLTPGADALEFVHNGIIRFHFPSTSNEGDDRIVRVRRPFLGELRTIRLALEDLQEEVRAFSYKVTIEGKALQAESNDLNGRLGREEITAEEHAEQLAEIRRKDLASARGMDRFREDKTLDWWVLVFSGDGQFGGLALDDVPDRMEYPGWILDARLPNLVLNHWRSTPMGPG